MREDWLVDEWPECEFHVFLAHVREDMPDFVVPLVAKLETAGVIVWGDWNPIPTEPRDWMRFLRDKLLRSRHVVYLVTENSLKQSRGWLAAERSYGAHLQSLLMDGDFRIIDTELALLTVPATSPLIEQTLWHPLIPGTQSVSLSHFTGDDLIEACHREILKLLKKTQQQGPVRLEVIQENSELARFLRLSPALEDRITGSAPSVIH